MRILSLSLLLTACRAEIKTPTTDTEDVIVTEADLDGDGYLEGDDCDDNDASIYPGATETCDGIDNDCDGNVDEEVTDTFYVDADGDGFGDPENTVEGCDAPLGSVPNGNDCDDSEPTMFPANTEVCDGLDNDCNGTIDEDIPSVWYLDADGDGYGDSTQMAETCLPEAGYIAESGDCNDSDPAAFPNAEEVCDSIDNNCDGDIDEGLLTLYYVDADLDGYGDNITIEACEMTEGLTLTGGDCDDADSQSNPGEDEVCGDSIDNNCNGVSDEPSAVNATVWYLDNDGDGYGVDAQSQTACDQPTGYVADSGDCDDTNTSIYTGAPELCDGIINDCATSTLSSTEIDDDGDGYVECSIDTNGWNGTATVVGGDDCDDTNNSMYPTADDVCDGADNDCNGSIDDDIAFFGLEASCAADNCLDIITQYSDAEDGVYWVNPDGNGPHEVYCDMTTDNGGWSLISVVRSDDASQVIVANNYCASIDPATNCKGKMPTSEANFADEILVYDLGSDEFIVYEGFETNGAFGYFTLNKQLAYDSTCTGYNHICGSAIDPNLSIARTSGYTYNYSGPLYQWWRLGGWWIGANPNSGNAIGRVHASSYSSSHDLRNRASSGSSTGQVSAGHQALYYR